MKKLLLLFALALTFNVSAQTEKWAGKSKFDVFELFKVKNDFKYVGAETSDGVEKVTFRYSSDSYRIFKTSYPVAISDMFVFSNDSAFGVVRNIDADDNVIAVHNDYIDLFDLGEWEVTRDGTRKPMGNGWTLMSSSEYKSPDQTKVVIIQMIDRNYKGIDTIDDWMVSVKILRFD